jgi:NAD(P)H-hydrate repair Nnr-like enzyme with NAD(P)H-hydrate dehydratase domain
MSPDDVVARHYDVGHELATTLGATVLLKGVPTVLTAPSGRSLVTARGNPVLATGGSGDLLAGIAATLLAQMDDPLEAGTCAAWMHGRAAELARPGSVRGATLDDVVSALAHVWGEPAPAPRPPVLAELPDVSAA